MYIFKTFLIINHLFLDLCIVFHQPTFPLSFPFPSPHHTCNFPSISPLPLPLPLFPPPPTLPFVLNPPFLLPSPYLSHSGLRGNEGPYSPHFPLHINEDRMEWVSNSPLPSSPLFVVPFIFILLFSSSLPLPSSPSFFPFLFPLS